jgi:CPA2 family monovalent cation:H+ antiporter-2
MLVIATIAIVMIGKPLAAIVITLMLRYPLKTAFAVGAVLAQIGEFSFIVGTMGMQYGILSEKSFNILVAAAIFSITLAPLAYRGAAPLTRWLARFPKMRKLIDPAAAEHGDAEISGNPGDRRAIVLGYGPVGQTLVRLLSDNGFVPTVVEMNVDTVQALKKKGISAQYGDAGHPDTLAAAGVGSADILVISASSVGTAADIIREAKRRNPKIQVLARTAYLREAEALVDAGADSVFTGEGEVALSMTESVLETFGATREQIDRESDRIRTKFFVNA